MPALPADPDPDVLRRWLAGDRSAFERIVRDWQGPIGKFLARMTGDPELAADLSQEVFFRVFTASGNYRESGQFRPWLYRIAVNLVRDAARKTARRNVVPLIGEPPEVAFTPNDAERQERARIVAAALAELTPPHREVVILRHYDDLSFEAMARVLDVPSTTLKSRFAAAMNQLRQRLVTRGLAPEEQR